MPKADHVADANGQLLAGNLADYLIPTATPMADHHHLFSEATGKLHDIPAEQLSVSGLPLPPAGTEIRRVEIIVRIHPGGIDHL